MANVSVAEFIDYAQRSQVAHNEHLRAALDGLRAEHAGQFPSDVDAVAQHLIAQGILTEWQCSKIREGKYRGFFLGKYKLLGHIGSGGMSTVYLAEHTKMHRRVAIKVLPRKRVDDSSYLERFYREAQSAAALDHANIVRAYDIDSDDSGLHYFVMEFVDGHDLKEVASPKNQPLDIELVVHYISQAAAGLQHAHEAGLVHRDVKPANLFVDTNQQLKLLDLGLALSHNRQNEQESLTETHDETVFGTADYLAPEQALNSHNVDARVDIYALGCTLYYALVGHAPFPNGTLAQRIAQHQSADPQPLNELRPDCPRSLVDICQRMMRKDPSQRYQTAGDVHTLLVHWLAERKSRWSGTYRAKSQTTGTVTSPSGIATSETVPPSAFTFPDGLIPTEISDETPFVITNSDSRADRFRGRRRKSKKEKTPPKTNAAPSATGAAPPTFPSSPNSRLVVTNPAAMVPVEVGIVTEVDDKSLLESRRERTRRAKKPPVGLWVFLIAMAFLAIGLAIAAVRSGAF